MRNVMKNIFLFLFIMAFPIFLHSEPVLLNNDTDCLELWDNVQIYVDKTSNLSADSLINVKWEQNRKKIIQYGLTGYTYWFKFTIDNPANESREYFLDTNDTQTEILEFYEIKNNNAVLLKKAVKKKKNLIERVWKIKLK